MKHRFSLFAMVAVGLGAVLAFALPAGAAVTVQSESPPTGAVALGARATLDANGAVVFAPIRVVCQPGSSAFLDVSVTQSVRGTIASGSASEEIRPCTGKVQQFEVAVSPTQRAFVRGVAFGRARLTVCALTCHTVRDQHNIEIVRR